MTISFITLKMRMRPVSTERVSAELGLTFEATVKVEPASNTFNIHTTNNQQVRSMLFKKAYS